MTLVQKKCQKPWTDKDRRKHQSWCLQNEIKVYIEPHDNIYGFVVTEIKGIAYHDNLTKYKLDNKPLRTKRKKGEPPHKKYSDVIFETYTNLYIKYHGKKKDNP